jgi:hypothetical protein
MYVSFCQIIINFLCKQFNCVFYIVLDVARKIFKVKIANDPIKNIAISRLLVAVNPNVEKLLSGNRAQQLWEN